MAGPAAPGTPGPGGEPAVTAAEVRRVAALARLSLTEAEAERLAGELAGILEHVAELGDVAPAAPAAPAAPTSGDGDPAPGPTPLRPDVPDRDTLAGDPSAFAPDYQDGYFRVPRLASHAEDGDSDAEADADADAEGGG